MKHRYITSLLALSLGTTSLIAARPFQARERAADGPSPQQALPGDWPQWQGPDRTGLSKEVGLLKEWPASGPALTWRASNLGAGYGSRPTHRGRQSASAPAWRQ